MTCCSHCVDSESLFNKRAAARDLKRYQRRGPRRSTRMLAESVAGDASGASLLDIGGGVGPIQHELFKLGLDHAIQVDASAAYIEKSSDEAGRRGYVDRVTYRHGDFVDVASEIPSADLVTLDRVICCYPDVEALVRASATKAEVAYGLVYPRDRWFVRLVLRLGNAFFRMRRSAFRTFIHPEAKVDGLLRSLGFDLSFRADTPMWRVATYRRVVSGESS